MEDIDMRDQALQARDDSLMAAESVLDTVKAQVNQVLNRTLPEGDTRKLALELREISALAADALAHTEAAASSDRLAAAVQEALDRRG